MVLTIVQLCTCVRALRLARDTRSGAHYNFYNYTTSILVLMLWVLPINMPVLIVWIHNVAVHWLTPFSTHHNLLAVLPLVLVVEVTYAYRLHHLLNILAAWLFAIHLSSDPGATSLGHLATNAASPSSNRLSEDATGQDMKKRP
jgi:glycosylphosphatidylinositol deacylase